MIVWHIGLTQSKGTESIMHSIGKTWYTAHMGAFADALCTNGVMR
jgi:hypothetical protein